MPGLIPVHNPPENWEPQGYQWIDGILWVPYKSLFPVGTTLSKASKKRCKCAHCASGVSKWGITSEEYFHSLYE